MLKLILAIGLTILADLAHAEGVRPGLWKLSLESAVAQSPDWKPQPFDLTQCLTESDAQNPGSLLLGMSSPGASGCEFPSRQYVGNRFTFEVSCGGSLGLQGHGQLDYTATSLDGFIDVTVGTLEKLAMQKTKFMGLTWATARARAADYKVAFRLN